MVASIDAIAQPCGKDFKSYLDIEHRCASGEEAIDWFLMTTTYAIDDR